MPIITEHESLSDTRPNGVYSTTTTAPRSLDTRGEPAAAPTLVRGSSLSLVAGITATVLAIIALSGYLSLVLNAIEPIAVGTALLSEGGAIAARWRDIAARTTPPVQAEIGGGVSGEVLGGLAGITLGVLALVEIQPVLLLPVAAIVLGACALLGAIAQPSVANIVPGRRVTFEVVEAASGAMGLAGLGSVILGILAVMHVAPAIELSAIAMLSLGAAMVLSGGAVAYRFGQRPAQLHS